MIRILPTGLTKPMLLRKETPRTPTAKRTLGTIAALFVGLATLSGSPGCVHTKEFRDSNGRRIPSSIATMEVLTIGGISQSIWFRGRDTSKPALILLHGGPGASESALFRHYNAALEHHFLVVYWEQRGAGRSYHNDIPPKSMTVARFVQDLDEVIDMVRSRFGNHKVVVLGHSWGTIVGALYAHQHPEKVAVYVGVAQIADMPQGDQLTYQFALSEARKRGNIDAISELERIGAPAHSVEDRLAIGEWVERFGGVFHGRLSTGKLIWAALSTDEANLVDLVQFGRGNRFSLMHLEREYSQIRLSECCRSFDVPIFFLLGRYDHHVPAVLAAAYFELIQAPFKRLVWFEESAHNPPFEEPDTFNAVLIGHVLPLLVKSDSR
jgi:proline iminopeptidase